MSVFFIIIVFENNIENIVPSTKNISVSLMIILFILTLIKIQINKKIIIEKIIKKKKESLLEKLKNNKDLLETKKMLLESLQGSIKSNNEYSLENIQRLQKIINNEKPEIEKIENNISIIQFELDMIGDDPIIIDL
jgi:hypothetical protein